MSATGAVPDIGDADALAHVVPVRDRMVHRTEDGTSCPCCPAVRLHREGDHLGVVVVHEAQDGRP